jgi:integrase-like protein
MCGGYGHSEGATQISMDGKGAWRDNVFVERLWRVKYEEVYLRAYDSVSDARASIGRYIDPYNRRRPHSSLDGMTPDRAYFGSPPMLPVRLAARPRQRRHSSKRKNCPNKRGHLTRAFYTAVRGRRQPAQTFRCWE